MKTPSRPRDEQDDDVENTGEETYRPEEDKQGSAGEDENRGTVPSRERSRRPMYWGAQWRETQRETGRRRVERQEECDVNKRVTSRPRDGTRLVTSHSAHRKEGRGTNGAT